MCMNVFKVGVKTWSSEMSWKYLPKRTLKSVVNCSGFIISDVAKFAVGI